MIKRLKHKKAILGLLGVLVLLAVPGHILTTPAEEYRFVTWKKAANDNEVKVEVRLSALETVQEAGTFQLRFHVAADDVNGIDDIGFTFDQGILGDSEIPVKTYRYNRENQTLTIYVSGRKEDTLSTSSLMLGTITATGDSDITLTVGTSGNGNGDAQSGMAEDSGCMVADDSFNLVPITEFGNMEPYVLRNHAGETPEETLPPETPEETFPPETPEETLPPETPEETFPPETPEETLPPETPEETPPENTPSGKPENRDTADSNGNDPDEVSGNWHYQDGAWTFTKEDGTRVTNDWIKVNGTWYRIGTDGKMLTGWISLNNTWYYLSPDGGMKTGWVNTGSQWYFLDPSGAMKTGWIADKGYWYYLSPDGTMKTGWNQIDGKWYYLDNDGKRLANTVTPDGGRVDRNGVRID